jgi:hypothetical protein
MEEHIAASPHACLLPRFAWILKGPAGPAKNLGIRDGREYRLPLYEHMFYTDACALRTSRSPAVPL